jgi:hypothetical protein
MDDFTSNWIWAYVNKLDYELCEHNFLRDLN